MISLRRYDRSRISRLAGRESAAATVATVNAFPRAYPNQATPPFWPSWVMGGSPSSSMILQVNNAISIPRSWRNLSLTTGSSLLSSRSSLSFKSVVGAWSRLFRAMRRRPLEDAKGRIFWKISSDGEIVVGKCRLWSFKTALTAVKCMTMDYYYSTIYTRGRFAAIDIEKFSPRLP